MRRPTFTRVRPSLRDELPLRNERGWFGSFTRTNAPGAIPAGSPVVKVNSDAEDANVDGTPGVVLGSISHPEVHDGAIMYFVEWKPAPRVAVGIMAHKIARANA